MGKVIAAACYGLAASLGGAQGALAADGAKDYPVRPVRLVVPQAPGGGIDFMARLIAAKLTDSLGQSVIVENRTGAGILIGTGIVVKSTADGHTLAVSSISMAFNVNLYKKLPYDTLKDLAPVGRIATSPNVLSVGLAGPKSVQELIQLAKSRAGKLNYGSGGIGGSDHVCMEYFLSVAGIKAVNVSYKGSAPALIDLAAGAIDVSFAPIASTMPLAKAGRLRILAVSTTKRTPTLPDVPTVAESGLPRFDYTTWYGLWAPAGTPRPVLERINDELRKALASPELRERIAAQGAETAPMTVDEFTAFFRAEVAKWAPIVKPFAE